MMFHLAGFLSRIVTSTRDASNAHFSSDIPDDRKLRQISGRIRENYFIDMDQPETRTRHSSVSDDIHHTSIDEDEDCIPVNLKIVILLSGKRKSGKDHISTLLTNYIGHERMRHLAILRIAGPIKQRFSIDHKLDLTRLLDSSEYKEKFRQAMVDWSEKYREDEGWNCFLKQAIKDQRAKYKTIWILNDARRPCDLEYFENDPTFADTKIIKIRVEASDAARMSRGWQFQRNIDDKPTECGLDEYDDWSYVITNNSNDNKDVLRQSLRPIFDEIDKALLEA